jgi:hypothetical protein
VLARRLAIVAITLGLLNACQVPSRPPGALLPGEMNLHARELDGTTVTAFGWLEYSVEERFLFDDSDARVGEVIEPRCVSLEVPQPLRAQFEALDHQDVVIQGRFLADIAQGRVFRGLCNRAGIQVESITRPPRRLP